MFPDGAPGVGLVLLRATVGSALIFCAWISWMPQHELKTLTLILVIVSVGCGLFVLLGLFTSIACTLSALISLGTILSLPSVPILNVLMAKLFAVFIAVIAGALLCLGPGAYSLDARRHGRREIIIPARPRSSNEA
jgi:putative oxidoreductase